MLAVEAVLQVNLGLPDQVVCAHQVPVVHRHREHGLHGEGGLDVKGPEEGAWEQGGGHRRDWRGDAKRGGGSFFLPSGGLGSGGVIHTWPVKPFETVPVIKG